MTFESQHVLCKRFAFNAILLYKAHIFVHGDDSHQRVVVGHGAGGVEELGEVGVNFEDFRYADVG